MMAGVRRRPPRSLARLRLAYEDLRKDFDALVRCLEQYTRGKVSAPSVHRENFRATLTRFPLPHGVASQSLADVAEPGVLRTILTQCGGEREDILALKRVSIGTRARIDAVEEEGLCVLGGQDAMYGTTLKTAEFLEPRSGEWRAMPQMLVRRVGFVAGVIAGRIFACGGVGLHGQMVEQFDPVVQKWKTTPPNTPMLNSPRFHAAGATVGGRLYVCGGTDPTSDTVHQSVEYFHPRPAEGGGECSLMSADMLAPRQLFAAAAITGPAKTLLLACGGTSTPESQFLAGVSVHATAEVLDLTDANGSWRQAAPLARPRMNHAAAALRGSIYIAGGHHGDCIPIVSIERFDGETETWSESPPPSVARLNPAMAALGNALYILGGFRSVVPGNPAFQSAELFEPASGRWQPAPGMLEGRGHFCAVAVKTGRLALPEPAAEG